MLSDIADASIAADRLGPERWEQLLRDHRALVEQVVTHHDGELLKSERDGFLASFNSAHAGLHAAVELQRAFSGPVGGAEDHVVAVRIGVHSGFVIANPDQLLGRNAVLASRIAAAAKGGEILVSSTLEQYTEQDPSFSHTRIGDYVIGRLLGEGGMGKVYEARGPDDTRVALTLVKADFARDERFRRRFPYLRLRLA